MKTMRMVLLASFVSAACAAFAQKAAVVEAVQFPAWLERGGHVVPLTPGTVLQPQDRLSTGANARAQLKLPEGSTVKLGEQAKFVFDRSEDRNIFRATLQVLNGAFRFTTDVLRKSQGRDVTIKVKNVTAGIRGTDLWGKSTGERDLVCLIEGKISVGSEGHPNVTLDQPLDFYQRPAGGAPSVSKVDEKQLAQWAQETELSKDGPAARAGGAWRVSAAAYKTRDEALVMNRKLRASGYPSEIVEANGIYSVRIAGLAGESEAHALLASLRSVPGVALPAVVPPGK